MSAAVEVICGYHRMAVNSQAYAPTIRDRSDTQFQACGGESSNSPTGYSMASYEPMPDQRQSRL
jgi:hypothetical protein